MTSKKLHLFVVIAVQLTFISAINDSTYVGCFKDSKSRHFTNLKNFGKDLTLATCRSHCRGYRYLGLQASDWCNCGDTLYKDGHTLTADSECNLDCTGDSWTKCGGRWRNSVYFGNKNNIMSSGSSARFKTISVNIMVLTSFLVNTTIFTIIID